MTLLSVRSQLTHGFVSCVSSVRVLTSMSSTATEVVFIRHGVTEMNEWLGQPGKGWGSPNFVDPGLWDTRLTTRGVSQALRLRAALEAHGKVREAASINGGGAVGSVEGGSVLVNDLTGLDTTSVRLICASPLTRALETACLGLGLCEPEDIRGLAAEEKDKGFLANIFRAAGGAGGDSSDKNSGAVLSFDGGKRPRLVTSPLCAERLYLSSDVGRSARELAETFSKTAGFDFEADLGRSRDGWWYRESGDGGEVEWRPPGDYCCPGEPLDAFEGRLAAFKTWLAEETARDCPPASPPTSHATSLVVVVAHWGVIHALTGQSLDNCGVVRISLGDLLCMPLYRHE
jgi:broad specificity phosphatase PhoE